MSQWSTRRSGASSHAGASPIGQTLRTHPEPDYPATDYLIVGVIADTKYNSLVAETPAMVYAPDSQFPRLGPWSTVMIRSDVPSEPLMRAVKAKLRQLQPGMVVESFDFAVAIRDGFIAQRLMAMLAGFFGVVAGLVAVVGIYGMVAYGVERRRRELGVRAALGATGRRLVGMVMRQAATLLAVGLAMGLVLGTFAGRGVQSMLFDIQPSDPWILGGGAALLAVSALAGQLRACPAGRPDQPPGGAAAGLTGGRVSPPAGPAHPMDTEGSRYMETRHTDGEMPPLQAGTGTSEPDEALVRRVCAGEAACFELLMRRHNERIYRTVRAVLGDDADVEDVMQQAYVSAYQHLAGFEGRARFSTWMTRIAINEAYARLRKRRRTEAAPWEDDTAMAEEPTAAGPTPEQIAARVEMHALLERAVDTLSVPNRMVFVLRSVEGLSTAETAACLEISEEAVKTRLHRANEALRLWLADAGRRRRAGRLPLLPPAL